MNSPHWTPLHAKIQQTLGQRQLLPPGARVLIAVSGGQDSVCLVKLLLDLQSHWGWELAIAHCDHLWPSDEGMSVQVEQLAQSLRLPFYLETPSQPVPEKEAVAREWRYQVLGAIALQEGFNYLVTGHTQSDRAETLLYNLMRGAGANGLGSLTWVRPLNTSLNLVRPLLTVARWETYEFCQRQQLPIWEDRVNQELKFTRNRIRQQLIPYLKEQFNPQVETHLAQTSELLKTEADYLSEIAHQLLTEILTPNQNSFNRLQLRGTHLAIQRRVIQQFLSINLPKSPNFEQIEAVVKLINAPNRSKTASFPGGVYLEVADNLIILVLTNLEI